VIEATDRDKSLYSRRTIDYHPLSDLVKIWVIYFKGVTASLLYPQKSKDDGEFIVLVLTVSS
jgi:hypothetical protein